MPNSTIPKIVWTSGSTYTLNFGAFPDSPIAYSRPRDGSTFVQFTSGIEDSWILGTDFYLECDLRWIPTSNTTNPIATGWDGVSGVRAFLEFARQKNTFDWYPNASGSTKITSYLVDDGTTPPTLEENGFRKVHLVLRNTSTDYAGY